MRVSMEKNEQNNEKVKWSKMVVRAPIEFIAVCVAMLTTLLFQLCLFFSIQALVRRTYFMDGPYLINLKKKQVIIRSPLTFPKQR